MNKCDRCDAIPQVECCGLFCKNCSKFVETDDLYYCPLCGDEMAEL